MQQWLKEVARGKKGSKDLPYEETVKIAETMLTNEATDAQIAAYLVAERIKMETPEELLAFIHTLQKHADRFHLSKEMQQQTIDFVGPYNGRNSFAATIPVSILLAEQGIPAFLSASDTLPPKYGTSLKSIIQALGLASDTDKSKNEARFVQHRFAFADTEKYCLPLASIRSIRKEIGVRTLFNTVEKLVNIAQARNVMLGAFHRTAINNLAHVFKQLDYDHVFLVQGLEGSEDVPVHRNSFVFDWTPDGLESFSVKPKDYGLYSDDFDKSVKLSAEEQAAIVRSVFAGEALPENQYYYHQILLNAGLRYYLFKVTNSIEEGTELADQQIKSGKAMEKLQQLQKDKCEVS
ncbi:anthranilate phosphoribosyltransferase [Gracilibacillus caseinilyticus]|uniref:Anthranilate phosphoribosyltransferase n=1 Tax=Gracilibacillus caseinilyticus TaxID=2932256 RepID=A0ABY4EUV5_9BACI|nr:anthranilate phosphoribosyltransferase [Gracilibacillus caseinilyticus]UOQ48064.1 anthranilate phosphoribosyltransferase [Gracilibacillus caseinilyticus]